MKSRAFPWRGLVFVALTYLAAALAAQWLTAAPGGHAFPLWPAAGFALAVLLVCDTRCWPGIWVGAFLYGLWLDASAAGAIPAALVAVGVTLQALLGARLTRRYVEAPIPLAREGDVWRFLLLGGPVACVMSASVGVLVLVGLRGVPVSDVAAQWFTWWGGDSLGVLLFTPLIMLVWPGRRHLWSGNEARIALPLLIVASLLVGGHFTLDRLESGRAQTQAEAHMEDVYRAGLLLLATFIESLNGAERFFSSSIEVTREEFANYMRDIAQRPEVVGVDWAPRVSRGQLAALEAVAAADGLTDYAVFELDADGQSQSLAERDEYFPVLFSAPAADNAIVLGLDHGFEAPRREAMILARDSGATVSTPVIPLLRTGRRVNLVFVPVFRADLDAGLSDVERRREALLGFVVGVVDLHRLLDPLVEMAYARRLEFRISDVTPTGASAILIDTLSEGAVPGWHRETTLAGRVLRLEMRPASGFMRLGATVEARVFLAFSLLAAFLVSFSALSAAGRAAATEAEVAARTNELREREQDLDITLRSIGDAVLA
ncbi:MAG: CHASE domain-containing protein, partial [Ectothiorhodospiraceae bacterium]|nr:CHASE domain-containing protein [Ectothiorhodospiraceae bacterium]